MDFREAKQIIMNACLSKVTLTEGVELRLPILLSLDDTENNKAKLFKEALADVSRVIGAEVRENPKSLEEVNEKNMVMVVFETRDFNGMAPDEIRALLKKTFKEISSGRGGVVVFDELQEASPMVQNLLLPVFQGEFEGMDMRAIQIGATTNSKAKNKITMPLLNRCLPCSPTDTVAAWMDRVMDGFEMIDGKIDLKSFLNGNERSNSDIEDFKDKFREALNRDPEIMDRILKEITADAPAEMKMRSWEDLLKDREIRQKAQQEIMDAAAGKSVEKTEKPEPFLVDISLKGASEILKRMKGAEAEPKKNDNAKPSV